MRTIDGKYHIENDQIIKTATGEVVPEEEPLFLLRARDPLAVSALLDYMDCCDARGCTRAQVALVGLRAEMFKLFRRTHPEAMKLPGSTLAPVAERPLTGGG